MNEQQQSPASNRPRRPSRAIRRETSAGGVVAREEDGQWFVALLKTEHKRGEVWVLPKGHVEPHEGETVADAARREVMEEAGITDLSMRDQLGITRYAFQAEEALVKKTVHYFLMTTQQKKLTPQAEEALTDARWAPIDEAVGLLAYDTDQDIVAKARQRLLGSLPPNYPPASRKSRPASRARRSAAPRRRPSAADRRPGRTPRLHLHT